MLPDNITENCELRRILHGIRAIRACVILTQYRLSAVLAPASTVYVVAADTCIRNGRQPLRFAFYLTGIANIQDAGKSLNAGLSADQ